MCYWSAAVPPSVSGVAGALDFPAVHSALKKRDSALSTTETAKDDDTGSSSINNFKPVTLTLQAFYKQVSITHVWQIHFHELS